MNETELAVVRWLRDRRNAMKVAEASGWKHCEAAMRRFARDAADAIERGEHKETNDAC